MFENYVGISHHRNEQKYDWLYVFLAGNVRDLASPSRPPHHAPISALPTLYSRPPQPPLISTYVERLGGHYEFYVVTDTTSWMHPLTNIDTKCK